MKNNLSYLDIETGEIKNLLNELIDCTFNIRLKKNIDCEPYEEGPLENGRQFMPLYVSKIVINGIFNDYASMRQAPYRFSLEETLKNFHGNEKIRALLRCADDNVTMALLIKPKNIRFSEKDMLNSAIAEYNEASSLKKKVRQNGNAGQKLAYLANHLGIYVPIIESVFELFSKNEKVLENKSELAREIEEMTSEEKSPLQAKIDAYVRFKALYSCESDIKKRLEMKKRLKEMFFSIETDLPTFRDDSLFGL